MARMLCKCGNTLGSSKAPSEYNLSIYYDSEIKEALAENSALTLNDFLDDWDELHQCEKHFMMRSTPVEYWFCPQCRRVYEMQSQVNGKIIRIFIPIHRTDTAETDSSWKQIQVFSDIDTDKAIEDNPDMLLSAYIACHSIPQYFTDSKEERILVRNTEDAQGYLCYRQDTNE